MSGDGPYEGEYPGQMGMPFDDEPARDAAGGRAPGADADDDLFVWTTCGRRGASSPGGRPTPCRRLARAASSARRRAGPATGATRTRRARRATTLDRGYER